MALRVGLNKAILVYILKIIHLLLLSKTFGNLASNVFVVVFVHAIVYSSTQITANSSGFAQK